MTVAQNSWFQVTVCHAYFSEITSDACRSSSCDVAYHQHYYRVLWDVSCVCVWLWLMYPLGFWVSLSLSGRHLVSVCKGRERAWWLWEWRKAKRAEVEKYQTQGKVKILHCSKYYEKSGRWCDWYLSISPSWCVKLQQWKYVSPL